MVRGRAVIELLINHRSLQLPSPSLFEKQIIHKTELPEIIWLNEFAGHERPAGRRAENRSEVIRGPSAAQQGKLVAPSGEWQLDDGCARDADTVIHDDGCATCRHLVAIEVRQVKCERHASPGDIKPVPRFERVLVEAAVHPAVPCRLNRVDPVSRRSTRTRT